MKKGNDFFELSSVHRQRIIELALESPRRHSDIVRVLKIAPAEVSRHLQRLVDSKYLDRGPDSKYTVTRYGELLYKQLGNLDHLCDNWKFFDTHDLSVIPKELFSLEILTGAGLLKGAMEVMGALYQMTANADVFVWSIFQAPADPFIMEHKHQLTSGLDLRLMFQEGARVPMEYSDNRLLPLEIRTQPNTPLGILMNEKKAVLLLPDIQGNIDYACAVTGTDISFLRWCSLLFEHHWESGNDVIL